MLHLHEMYNDEILNHSNGKGILGHNLHSWFGYMIGCTCTVYNDCHQLTFKVMG